MARSPIARRVLAACAGLACGLAAAGAATAAEWVRVPLPPPPGGTFPTPVGLPGDLSFWAPNRGLMTVGGNNAVPEGVYSWDGVAWHQLAVVCGGGASARVAWAGPREFWTIARPSLPRPQGAGIALCHFKDGAVVGSYSTPSSSADPYRTMRAAACLAPDDCWFSGEDADDPTGQRSGAFNLHWDGQQLRTVYGPADRDVTDLLAFGGQLWASSAPPSTLSGAPAPLLHRISGDAFPFDPLAPAPPAGGEPGGGALTALDGAGAVAWAVGGGRRSSTGAALRRPPIAARREGGVWSELTLTGAGLSDGDYLADVAAIPGTRSAWAVVRAIAGEPAGSIRVALIGADGAVDVQQLAGPDDPERGAAARIACPAPDDCWLATDGGHLFRHSDAAPYERDADPAFQGTIVNRPNEAAEQSIPDAPPNDDSLLNAPPIELAVEPPPAEPCRAIPSAVSHVKARVAGPTRLVVSFRLRRRASVGLVAYRGGRRVARRAARRMRPGRRSIALSVSRRRWPTRLRFVVRGARPPARRCAGGAAGSSVGGDRR